MMMIILGHTIGHSHATQVATGLMDVVVNSLYVMIMPAVNVYVLISGYFLVNAKWNCKRVVLLWLQVFFYSVLFYALALLGGITSFSPSEFLKVLLPISGNQYWFARVFWCFTLFAPFAAMLLRSLSKKQFQFFLALIIVIFSLWRSFLPFSTTVNVEGGNSIMWFFILFAFAAYFRLHGTSVREMKAGFWAGVFVLSSLLSVSSFFIIRELSHWLGFAGKGTSLFTEYTSITMLGMSVGLFMFFVRLPEWNLSEKGRKLILFFSGATYSVYLIHENIYVKRWLWDVVQPVSWLETGYFLPLLLATVVAIFFICALIDAVSWKQIKRLVECCKFSRVQSKVDILMNQ